MSHLEKSLAAYANMSVKLLHAKTMALPAGLYGV
jgi:hypothetical protein